MCTSQSLSLCPVQTAHVTARCAWGMQQLTSALCKGGACSSTSAPHSIRCMPPTLNSLLSLTHPRQAAAGAPLAAAQARVRGSAGRRQRLSSAAGHGSAVRQLGARRRLQSCGTAFVHWHCRGMCSLLAYAAFVHKSSANQSVSGWHGKPMHLGGCWLQGRNVRCAQKKTNYSNSMPI